jgi:hypothetical protein
MDFGELCNEFECISSPLVESTARQLVRDILQLREGNRALGTFAVSVRYQVFFHFFVSRKKKGGFARAWWSLECMLAWLMNLKLFFTLSDNQKRKIISISCF